MAEVIGPGLQFLLDEFEERLGKASVAPYLQHVLDMDVSEATREIFIQEEIDDETGGWFTKVVRRLVARSHDPITIWLNTPGGDMESMFVYHDVVTTCPAPICVVATGTVASAGCLMLACASREQDLRMVSESTYFMWHESRGGDSSDLTESEERARRVWKDWQGEHWRKLMGRHVSTTTSRFWRSITNKEPEHYLLGGKAIVEAGIADALFDSAKLPAPARALTFRPSTASRGEGS